MKHTDTPWQVSRAYCDNGSKYIDIMNNSYDEVVNENGITSWENAEFIIKACNNHYQLLEALENMTERYVELVECGDCGHWNPETDNEVIAARKAIEQTEVE